MLVLMVSPQRKVFMPAPRVKPLFKTIISDPI